MVNDVYLSLSGLVRNPMLPPCACWVAGFLILVFLYAVMAVLYRSPAVAEPQGDKESQLIMQYQSAIYTDRSPRLVTLKCHVKTYSYIKLMCISTIHLLQEENIYTMGGQHK